MRNTYQLNTKEDYVVWIDDSYYPSPPSYTDEETDLFNLVSSTFIVKTVFLKEVLEAAIIGYFKKIDSKTFANLIIMFNGRTQEIQYLTELYKTALTTPTQTPRRGFLMSG